MAIQKVNFELKTDHIAVVRRDFGLSDPTNLLSVTSSTALIDGEWVTFDDTPATLGKLVRATDIGSVGGLASKLAFPVWAERGRTDVMAMSEKKVPILYMGFYEADTRVFDASAVAGGAAITTTLQPLCLATVTIGSRNYTGLVGSSYTSNNLIVGYAVRLPSTNGGKLRFINAMAVRNGTTLAVSATNWRIPMLSARAFNDAFMTKVGSTEAREKLAEVAGSFIRDRLRETSYCRKVLPPEQVTRADCQRSVNHDTLVKIIDIEPRSRAMSVSFRGDPTVEFMRGQRAEIAFYSISSQIYQKNEQELLAYEMPITKIIEENSVKDIQEIEDRDFTLHIEAAVQALQAEANGGVPTALNWTNINAGSVVEFSVRKGELARSAGTDDATVRPIQRPDIVNLFKMLDGNRLRCERLLMTEVDYDDLLQWTAEDFGQQIQSETVVDGYKYNTLLGRPYIRTIKTDLLRPGNVYAFTKPEFFGKLFVLNNTKFYIDKVANMISFRAWEDIGMGILNVAAVRKMELYSADANPSTNANSLVASFRPVDEENLGALNNRVDEGLKFPNVTAYLPYSPLG